MSYLVYDYRGTIKIQTGEPTIDYSSFRISNSSDYKTKIPKGYMKVYRGKVLCGTKEMIPEAIDMIEEWREEVEKKKNIKNIRDTIKECTKELHEIQDELECILDDQESSRTILDKINRLCKEMESL
jgi:predicted transcriptional regulator